MNDNPYQSPETEQGPPTRASNKAGFFVAGSCLSGLVFAALYLPGPLIVSGLVLALLSTGLFILKRGLNK